MADGRMPDAGGMSARRGVLSAFQTVDPVNYPLGRDTIVNGPVETVLFHLKQGRGESLSLCLHWSVRVRLPALRWWFHRVLSMRPTLAEPCRPTSERDPDLALRPVWVRVDRRGVSRETPSSVRV